MSHDDEIKTKKKEAMKKMRKDRKEWITRASTMVKEQKKIRKAIKEHLEINRQPCRKYPRPLGYPRTGSYGIWRH